VGVNGYCDEHGLSQVKFFGFDNGSPAITNAQLAVNVLSVGTHCGQGDH
jgi:hypothetical protein